MNILQAQLKAQKEKRSYALATIVKTEGSTPRGVGSKMIVFADGSFVGTVGGGVLEKQVVEDAARCVRDREKTLREYENRPDSGAPDSPCGGVITVFIEMVEGAPELVVCGAGHVGGCVIRLAAGLGYNITAVDTRDTEMTKENARQADRLVLVDDFYKGIKSLNAMPGAFYLVCTYGHAEDCEALAAVLEKDAAYIGMLGSRAKIDRIFAKLRERGFDDSRLAAVRAPVGLRIGGDTPEEIALSIAAEMQTVRYGAPDINRA